MDQLIFDIPASDMFDSCMSVEEINFGIVTRYEYFHTESKREAHSIYFKLT